MEKKELSLKPEDLRNDIEELFQMSGINRYETLILKCMIVSLGDKLLPGELEDIWRFSLQRAKSLLQKEWPGASFEEEIVNTSYRQFLERHSIKPVD